MAFANPYAPPIADSASPALAPSMTALGALGPEESFTMAKVGAKGLATWRLGFHPGGMTLEGPEGDRESFTRQQVIERFDVNLFGNAAILRFKERKQSLQLDEDGSTMLQIWAQPMTGPWGEAAAIRAFKPRLFAAIFFSLWAAMTWVGGGTPSLLIVLFALGSVVSAAGARLRPGRWLFAWGGAYLATVAMVVMAQVFLGDRSWPWLLAVGLGAIVINGWARQFMFFRPRD